MVRFRPGFSRKRLTGQLVWPGLWLAVTVAGLWLTPNPKGYGTHTQLGLPPCPSTILWDRPCPGCGLTTSISATLHGDLALAWHAHPFGPIVYALLTLAGIAALYGYLKVLRLDYDVRWGNVAVLALLAVYLLHGALRFVAGPRFSEGEVPFARAEIHEGHGG